MGPDGYTWGREYISKEPDTPRQLVLKKKWFGAMLFGRLAYDPDDLQEGEVEKIVAERYPEIPAGTLLKAWTNASRITPLVSQFHYQSSALDFQWYPEACLKFPSGGKPHNQFSLHTVQDFIDRGPQPGSNMVGIRDFVEGALSGRTDTSLIAPPEVAARVRKLSEEALHYVRSIPRHGRHKELRHLLDDIEAMAYLGRYYSSKILGATNKAMFDKSGGEEFRKLAILDMRDASWHWKTYAAKVSSLYEPQYLTRFHCIADPKRIDLVELQAQVDQDIVAVGGKLE